MIKRSGRPQGDGRALTAQRGILLLSYAIAMVVGLLAGVGIL